ncbi:SpoIIE family protein phosphatase [Desulforhopalus vacuolatus]|uniref:SpoIIE family protein phosphatase n=1 Tax=Desulforhopalus vacuolatus TaxID=40414 RepID=UPI001963FC90|nr:SpoIIE family protein phosphatase [Desulforhopalus vacuolatus]MBM9518888.1 SpoIIE family protein phosphatase [Desulforhopalus vacuolatus]
MRLHGIAFRLASLTLVGATLILTAILGYNYTVSRSMIVSLAEERGTLLADYTAENISGVFNAIQKVMNTISFSLEDAGLTTKQVNDLGWMVLNDNPEIFGSAIAFEPYAFQSDSKYYAPYHYRSNNDILFERLGGKDYQYFYMDWYQLPRELERSVWTEPYYDKVGDSELMTTYAVPFYRMRDGHKVLKGVVTADISLSWVQKLIAGLSDRESGYVFMLSRYGTFIAHPDANLVMNETIFTRAEKLKHPQLREVGRRMVAGESDVVELKDMPVIGDSFLYFSPLLDQQWSIGVVFPKKEIMADVSRLNREVATLGILGFVVLVLLITCLASRITRPLRKLTVSAHDMASGNLEAELPVTTSKDEVGELTSAFQTMQDSIKNYITNLTETTAAKERIESELRIAHDIQMSILPKLFPAFPERKEFDIYASIEPAKEVGGDLYDFFFVDETHFCFLVGDVSGKGVPAAFFMAVTKTLLKVVAERTLDPGEVLIRVNNDLAEDNDACMFVTLFLAVMEISTGKVRYASAGHNPPLLMTKRKGVEWIPPLNELVAGVMEDTHYTTKSMTLSPGDTLFIYTDGVTEAMDSTQELYSEERLEDVMNQCQGKSAEQIIRTIDGALKDFTGGAEQSDDITMLAMQYLGTNSES